MPGASGCLVTKDLICLAQLAESWLLPANPLLDSGHLEGSCSVNYLELGLFNFYRSKFGVKVRNAKVGDADYLSQSSELSLHRENNESKSKILTKL